MKHFAGLVSFWTDKSMAESLITGGESSGMENIATEEQGIGLYHCSIMNDFLFDDYSYYQEKPEKTPEC